MKVSVVIPTRNGGGRFREVLPRIFSQKMDTPFEVVCVDSESSDGTSDYAASLGARVISIDARTFNHGLTRNLGIRESKGDFVALIVQDALPFDDQWLARLVNAVAEDEKAAGGYSRQIPREDCDPIIKDRLMHWSASRPDKVIQEVKSHERFEDLPAFEKLSRIAFDNVSSCIRRSCWERHPFPKRNFGEDVAWGFEVIRNGFRIVFEPASAVIHSHNNSIWYEFKRIYADHQNLNRLIGLTTVPRFLQTFSNAKGAFRHYRRLIAESGLPITTRCFKTLRALPYAYLENLAQYLGARFQKRVKDRKGWAMLDHWLKRGV